MGVVFSCHQQLVTTILTSLSICFHSINAKLRAFYFNFLSTNYFHDINDHLPASNILRKIQYYQHYSQAIPLQFLIAERSRSIRGQDLESMFSIKIEYYSIYEYYSISISTQWLSSTDTHRAINLTWQVPPSASCRRW